jgi:hypothetical protein
VVVAAAGAGGRPRSRWRRMKRWGRSARGAAVPSADAPVVASRSRDADPEEHRPDSPVAAGAWTADEPRQPVSGAMRRDDWPEGVVPVALDLDQGPSPDPGWDARELSPDPDRVAVEVMTTSGRGAQVVFQLQRDLVEVMADAELLGVFDRGRLRTWLRKPLGELAQGQVRLGLDRMVDQDGRIALTLPFVRDWTLSPVEAANLKDRV